MPTCDRCSLTFPNRAVVKGKRRHLGKRRFCLDCSPFGKNNRRDLAESEFPHTKKRCARCREEKEHDEFYRRKGSAYLTSYCRACTNWLVVEKLHRLKTAAVAYKGGCCNRCGYDRYIGALEFHHRSPEHKDFQLSSVRESKFSAVVKAELDKCDMLCANCHREEHARLKGLL